MESSEGIIKPNVFQQTGGRICHQHKSFQPLDWDEEKTQFVGRKLGKGNKSLVGCGV